MAFDLGELLKDVPKLDTDREQIEYIRLDLIDEDPNNFYQLSGVEELAANIELCGLQQPIRVRNSSENPNRYTIVSGHRRRKAIELLAKDNPDRWGEVACIVETDVVSPALQQLRLIYANANTRTMTSAEISEQAVQVEKLLYQLKEDGYDFPGRMRDHVAQAVGKSKSKLARLKVIRDNLEDCWNPGYKSDELGESVAYALAQMPGHHQIAIYLYWMDKDRPLRQLYEGTVKNYAKHLEKLDKLHCSNFNERCRNQEGKRHKVLSISSWQTCSCVDKCCAVCSDLGRCKYACPELADQIKKVKEDAREQRKQEKLAKEAEERPIIQKIQQYWNRFGEARNAADVSVKSFFKACGRYYGSSEDEKIVKMECLEGTFTTTTSLPYGYSCYLDDIDKLVRVADLFGCSLDYLFCRTDIREMVQSEPKPKENVPNSDTMWHPISEEPPTGVKLVWLDGLGYSDTAVYLGCQQIESISTISWIEARYWAFLPKED